MFKTIEWTDAGVVMIDQRRLPREERYVTCRSYTEVAQAIRDMVIRGAPAIGVAAAMGMALAALESKAGDAEALKRDLDEAARALVATRPTAVNLAWAVRRMEGRFAELLSRPVGDIRAGLAREAQQILLEDIAVNQAIGRHGADLLPEGRSVMTHCNTGSLATGGYGTALGIIRAAADAGRVGHVYSCETRPFLQGARLTVWELQKDGIPTTLITDNMAGHMMKSGKVGAVVVGADRIAANGDVANKIGTYTLAVLARENNIPFYVAAPTSTLDLSIPTGDQIPIEQRAPDEVTHVFGVPIAPEGTPVENPAFDVTPHRYITAIVTERGVARAPYTESLRAQMAAAKAEVK